MISYSGVHITRSFGNPTLRDMAVQGMRLARFGGAGEVYFPVGLHSLLVADLLPPELEHHGLLHDVAAEVCVGDVPRPFKTDEAKLVEATVHARTYIFLGLELPTLDEAALIHAADIRAVNAEGTTGYGPRGFQETQPGYVYDDAAFKRFKFYLDEYPLGDLLHANGRAARDFESRLRRAICRAQASQKTIDEYTKAA